VTKRSRRELEKALAHIRELLSDDDGDTVVRTECVVITQEMFSDDGNLDRDKVPDTSPPDGYDYGEVLPTKSPVVTVHELTPVGDDE
jgi:hypothetical protein